MTKKWEQPYEWYGICDEEMIHQRDKMEKLLYKSKLTSKYLSLIHI